MWTGDRGVRFLLCAQDLQQLVTNCQLLALFFSTVVPHPRADRK